jgi:hypothetical protein
VRARFYPNEGPPIWTGVILWRGITRGKPFLTGRTIALAGHEAQKFIACPISRAALDRGEAEINWIAELKFRPRPPLAAGGSEPRRSPRGIPAAVRRLAFRLAGSAGGNRSRRPLLRIPNGRSRPVAAPDAWTRYAAGRRGASDVSDRIERRLAADSGCARAASRDPCARRNDGGAGSIRGRTPSRTAAIVAANRGNGPDQVLELVELKGTERFCPM